MISSILLPRCDPACCREWSRRWTIEGL